MVYLQTGQQLQLSPGLPRLPSALPTATSTPFLPPRQMDRQTKKADCPVGEKPTSNIPPLPD